MSNRNRMRPNKFRLLIISKKISEGCIFLSGAVIIGSIIVGLYLFNDSFRKIPGMIGWEDPSYGLRYTFLNSFLKPMIVSSMFCIFLFTLLKLILSRRLKILGYAPQEKKLNHTINSLKLQRIQEDGNYFRTSP